MTDEKLIELFASGIKEKRYVSVAMRSNRLVIFKIAGHMTWGGRGCRFIYEPVRHILIGNGKQWMDYRNLIKDWEGRVSKRELEKALETAEKKLGGGHEKSNDKSVRVFKGKRQGAS